MNTNRSGVSLRLDGKYYAYIKINQRMYNLGVYIDPNHAYYARWYAETILFKDYRYPKDKPDISHNDETVIKKYVNDKLAKYGAYSKEKRD